jgi:uncharacterized protein
MENTHTIRSRWSAAARRWSTRLAVLGMVMVLAACVRLLEPRQSNVQYYVLGSADALETQNATDESDGPSVGLRRVHIADYLDAAALVTRRGEHTIRFAEFHRWGEDLARAINRTVAARLLAMGGVGTVDVVPFTSPDPHDYLVQLRVLRFEGKGPPPLGPDEDPPEEPFTGTVQMTIAWEVFAADTETSVARGTTRHQTDGWTVGDYPDLVAKLDAAIAVLADDLRQELQSRP